MVCNTKQHYIFKSELNNQTKDNYFNEREIDYEKVLNRITFKIVDDIKTRAAVRGYTLACIHKYKYRINEEYNMFNVLVEWSYGMLNPPKRINVVN